MKGPFDYWFSGGSQTQPKAAQPAAAPSNPSPTAWNPSPGQSGNVSDSGSVSASSFGTGGNTMFVPDVSKYSGPPVDLSKYVYSVPAGGYITADEANNSNSAANKYNLQDPMANQTMKNYYAALGRLPTIEVGGSGALNALRLQQGIAPRTGESYESMLGHDWGGPWEVLPEHPSSQPRVGGWGG